MEQNIRSKDKSLEGYVLGVKFVKGEAKTDAPAALAFFGASDKFEIVDPSKATKIPTGHGTP